MTQPLKLSDIRLGAKLRADEAFECISPGRICEVHFDEQHGPYVHCAHNRHFLDGQLNHDGELVGFELVSS